MFKNCLGFSNINSSYELKTFDNKSRGTPKYDTYKCNDYELSNLTYLGPLQTHLNSIKHFFGQPQIFNCYKGKFAFEYVWYIKFKDGTRGSIVKSFKNNYHAKYNNDWKIYGSSEKVMGHIILLFL
jgi:hypothetical protein